MSPSSAAKVAEAGPSAGGVDDGFEIELAGYCGRPSCRKQFQQIQGRGRRREFCSDTCRRGADKDYKRAKAMVEHFEALVTRSKYDLASFGRGDEEIATPEAQLRTIAAAGAALQRAHAVLEWAQGGDERLLSELRLLVEAVAPAIEA